MLHLEELEEAVAKRPTMIEIGERAGVSQATVSLVLNRVPNARVADATRARVLEAAEALGYRKGPQHHVPENKTRVIGLLLDEVTTTPFATLFIEGAREEAALQDVVIATFSTRSDPKLESLALDMLLSNQIIGVLYASLVTRPVEVPERLHGHPDRAAQLLRQEALLPVCCSSRCHRRLCRDRGAVEGGPSPHRPSRRRKPGSRPPMIASAAIGRHWPHGMCRSTRAWSCAAAGPSAVAAS